MKLNNIVDYVVKNWDFIPDKFKEDIKENRLNLKGVCDEGHIVVLFLDRQKPSIEASYYFDRERIGINKFGQFIWGFDSGCSCPSPFDDHYPECYEFSKSWKEFEVNIEKFDKDLERDIVERFNEIKIVVETSYQALKGEVKK